MHLGRSAPVPGREQNTAAAALVRDILEAIHDVGNTSQTAEAAKTKSPGTEGGQLATTLTRFDVSLLESGLDTYCVVFPVSNAQLVMLLCPHAGQSAGAGPRPRFAMGVAFWYTGPEACWGGMPGCGCG